MNILYAIFFFFLLQVKLVALFYNIFHLKVSAEKFIGRPKCRCKYRPIGKLKDLPVLIYQLMCVPLAQEHFS